MSRSYLAKTVVVVGVAALTLTTPATAFAASHAATAAHHPAQSASPHGKKHHGKPAAARFTAVGVVTAVDATSGVLTINDKGGSRDLHGKSVTVTVGSTTKVTRADASATLAQLQFGDRIMANGTRAAAGVLNAAHINASSDPDPEPTVAPDTAPTVPTPITPPTTT